MATVCLNTSYNNVTPTAADRIVDSVEYLENEVYTLWQGASPYFGATE